MISMIRILLTAFLVLCMLPASSLGNDYDGLLEEALDARKQGKYLQAASLLQQAYDIQPDPILLNNIGKMYEEAGQYQKAYNTYKEVADDPNADSGLRAKDEQRMNNLKPMLSQGHFVIKSDAAAINTWLGDRVDKSTYRVEQQRAPGRHYLEIQTKKECLISPITLVTAERITIDLGQHTATATTRISGVGVSGLETIAVNGYELQSDLDGLDAVRLTPGLYEIELSFSDGSKYEITKTFTKDTKLNLESYATTFTRTETGAGFGSGPQENLWIKSSAVALGVGLTTAGGFMSYNAHSDTDDIMSDTSITMFDAKDRWVEARASGDRGVILMSVGLTALTGGVLWLMLDQKDGRSSDLWEFGPTMPYQPAFTQSQAAPLHLNEDYRATAW